MDELRRENLERLAKMTPAERLLEGLALMEAGFQLKREQFERRFPDATPEEIEDLMQGWVSRRP